MSHEPLFGVLFFPFFFLSSPYFFQQHAATPSVGQGFCNRTGRRIWEVCVESFKCLVSPLWFPLSSCPPCQLPPPLPKPPDMQPVAPSLQEFHMTVVSSGRWSDSKAEAVPAFFFLFFLPTRFLMLVKDHSGSPEDWSHLLNHRAGTDTRQALTYRGSQSNVGREI